MFRTDPIVIVGMHRSGTSFLSRIFELSGVFMGSVKEANNESIAFLRHNEQVLKKEKTSWHSSEIKNKTSTTSRLFDPSVIAIIQRKHGLTSETKHWGWKDPRTTLYMNEYYQTMNKAKFIHIYRNPYDVISSLCFRQKKLIEMGVLRRFYLEIVGFFKYGTFIRKSNKLLSTDYCFALWKKYTLNAFNFDGDIIHIRYEDLLLNHTEKLKEISSFTGLKLLPLLDVKMETLFKSHSDKEMIKVIEKYNADELVVKLSYTKKDIASLLND